MDLIWTRLVRRPGPFHQLPVFVVGLLFVLGVGAGAVTVQLLDLTQQAELMAHVDAFVQELTGAEAQAVFAGPELAALALERHLRHLLILWVAGLVIVGVPLVLGYITLQAFAVGFTVAVLIFHQGATGLALAVASLLPHYLLIVPAWLLLGVGALSYVGAARRRTPVPGRLPPAAAYTAVCLAAALLLTTAAVVEAYVTPSLMVWLAAYLY